jgi:hypothetical protein
LKNRNSIEDPKVANLEKKFGVIGGGARDVEIKKVDDCKLATKIKDVCGNLVKVLAEKSYKILNISSMKVY